MALLIPTGLVASADMSLWAASPEWANGWATANSDMQSVHEVMATDSTPSKALHDTPISVTVFGEASCKTKPT